MAKAIPEGISSGLAGLLTEMQERLASLERVRPNVAVGDYRITTSSTGQLIAEHVSSGTVQVLMENPVPRHSGTTQ